MTEQDRNLANPNIHDLQCGDRVDIGQRNLDTLDMPQFGNFQTLAKLTVGGVSAEGGHYPAETLYLLKSDNPSDRDFVNLAARASEMGDAPSDYIIAAASPEGGVTGMAFIRENVPNRFGRKGNLNWVKYGAVGEQDAGWQPFADNRSISREQFWMMPGNGRVSVSGLSKNSHTVIEAADLTLRNQLPVAGETEDSQEAAQYGARKKSTVANRIATRLRVAARTAKK